MKKPKPITATTEDELKKLPDVTYNNRFRWTPEQDQLILKYCPIKGILPVSAILGVKYDSLRRHYNELKASQK